LVGRKKGSHECARERQSFETKGLNGGEENEADFYNPLRKRSYRGEWLIKEKKKLINLGLAKCYNKTGKIFFQGGGPDFS